MLARRYSGDHPHHYGSYVAVARRPRSSSYIRRLSPPRLGYETEEADFYRRTPTAPLLLRVELALKDESRKHRSIRRRHAPGIREQPRPKRKTVQGSANLY
jgi:hypothetical protein